MVPPGTTALPVPALLHLERVPPPGSKGPTSVADDLDCPSTRSSEASFDQHHDDETKEEPQHDHTTITATTTTTTAAKPTSCLHLGRLLFRRQASYTHVRLPPATVRAYLRQHGTQAMAYVHLHPNQYHFKVPALGGLVSYCWALSFLGRVALVAVDPLCARAHLPALLATFHATVPGMKQYVAVSEAVASVLREPAFGYSTTIFGRDYYCDLALWRPPHGRRRFLNEGRRAGLVVKELTWAEVQHEAARIHEISDRWLATKKGGARELQLMTWPFHVEDEWGVRKFYVWDREGEGSQMLGYMFFTPCFRDGRLVGYQANILRRDPTVKHPSYALDFLLLHCVQLFRDEGLVQFVGLSLAPMYGLGKAAGDAPLLRRVFQLWFDFPIALYGFKGLGQHKDHYHCNRVEPVYACTKGTRAHVSVQQVILTATNVLPVAKALHGISSSSRQ